MSQPTETTPKAVDPATKAADVPMKPVDNPVKATDIAGSPADTRPADVAAKAPDITTRRADFAIKPSDIEPKPAEVAVKPADIPAKPAGTTMNPPDATSNPDAIPPPTGQILKQWILKRYGRHSEYDIYCDGTLILSASKERKFQGGLAYNNVSTVETPSGPVLATCKSRKVGWSKNMDLALGNEQQLGKSDYQKLRCPIFLWENKWRFEYKDQWYTWTRTHDKQLGARRRTDRDFKLVEEATGEVLAVWVDDKWLLTSDGATISWYAHVEEQLQFLSLAAILRVEDHIRNRERRAFPLGVLAGLPLGVAFLTLIAI